MSKSLYIFPLTGLLLIATPAPAVNFAPPDEETGMPDPGRRNSFSDADYQTPAEQDTAVEEDASAQADAAPTALAAEPEPEPAAAEADSVQQNEATIAFERTLKYREGHIVLGANIAELNLPAEYLFLDKDDARKVIEDFWGNPPGSGSDILGMIVPKQGHLDDADSWGAIISYVSEGHVKDDDAKEINYTELLANMKKDSAEQNKERMAKGFETLQLVDWAVPPHYDSANHVLHWAKKLQDKDGPNVLNYDVRFLGREGILSLMIVGSTDQLPKLQSAINDLPQIAQFPKGKRYEDFNASTDKMAEYGLATLVAGGAAAAAVKAGKFAFLLVFLKKFGVFLLAGLVLAGRKIKEILGR